MTGIKLRSGAIVPIGLDANKIYEAIKVNSLSKEQADSVFLKLIEFFGGCYGDIVYEADLAFGTVEYMRTLVGLTKEEAMIVVGAAYDLRQGKEALTYADNS